MSRPTSKDRLEQLRSARLGWSGPPEEDHVGSADESSGRQVAIPAATILPLRAFLGITFLYAAIQKVADPGFLHPGSSTYIGAQMRGYTHGSPIAPFFTGFALHHPTLVGFSVIVTEWAVGVLTVLGLFTRLAALVGLGLNFGLFLTASWTVYPYFLGSDIVFCICWGTLFLTGPGPYAVDGLPRQRGSLVAAFGREPLPLRWLSRYQVLAGGIAAVALVILGLLPRTHGSSQASGATGLPTPRPKGRGAAPPSRPPGIPPNARLVGTVSQIPVNSAASLTDPRSGDPALIIRLAQQRVVAFDATCTHAGCTVTYDPSTRLIQCPCHGAQYDPARGAAVVQGPAPSPLTRLTMAVDGQGNIYLV